MEKIFTVIVPFENEKELNYFFSVNNNRIFDDTKIQWIFLLSRQLIEHATNNELVQRETTIVYDKKYDGIQAAVEKSSGRFINFSNALVRFEKMFFIRLRSAINKHKDNKVFSTGFAIDKNQSKKNILNYIVQSQTIDLMSAKAKQIPIPMYPYAYFVDKELIKRSIIPNCCDSELEMMHIIHALEMETKLIVTPQIKLFYALAANRGPKLCIGNKDVNFYSNTIKEFYIPLLEKYALGGKDVPYYLQRIAYYQLYFRFRNNFNALDKQLLVDDKLQEFLEYSGYLLSYIDDGIIIGDVDYEQYSPTISIRNMFIHLKYSKDKQKMERKLIIDRNKILYSQCGHSIENEALYRINIKAITVCDDKLMIDLSYELSLLDMMGKEPIKVYLNGQSQQVIPNEIYSLTKVFGKSINRMHTFRVELPLSNCLTNGARIDFFLEIEERKRKLNINFQKTAAKLNTSCDHSFWRVQDNFFLFCEDNSLIIRYLNSKEIEHYEKIYISELKRDVNNIETYKNVKAVRRSYYREAKKKNKKIWMYFDKLYKAGDNGEYQFRYAMNNKKDDGIEHYYILNKDASEWEQLNADYPGHIVEYGSIECKLLSLLADNIIATHPDVIEFCGFSKEEKKYVRDLFNGNIICIAHGITIQKNADYQNKLYDNTVFYTTSSKYEVNHLLQRTYGYNKTEIALTGMARFDGLVNNDKKIVLITPTWRRGIVGTAEKNTSREYSDGFKSSWYYKIYNSLINDERIISVAKEKGYRIVFLLHPAMSAQINDYVKNDYVEIIPAAGNMSYEKILTESSLMITDYSGIHYDFGYMRKPVVYYQPKEVPMRFEEGGMKFRTMGFGPVCTEYEEAVATICELIKNGCEMPTKYRQNADDFFAFNDYNNCSRIYDAIRIWSKNRENMSGESLS